MASQTERTLAILRHKAKRRDGFSVFGENFIDLCIKNRMSIFNIADILDVDYRKIKIYLNMRSIIKQGGLKKCQHIQ